MHACCIKTSDGLSPPVPHLGVELCLHIPLYPQHLSEGILVAIGYLKLLPTLPVQLVNLIGLPRVGAMLVISICSSPRDR